MKLHCIKCGKVFNKKKNLANHYLNQHTLTRKYASYLEKKGHKMRFVATSPKIQYQCKECGKLFVNKLNLSLPQSTCAYRYKNLFMC